MEEIRGWSEGKKARERKGEREKRRKSREEVFEDEGGGGRKNRKGGGKRKKRRREGSGGLSGWRPFPSSTNPLDRRETRYSGTLCSSEKQPDCAPKVNS